MTGLHEFILDELKEIRGELKVYNVLLSEHIARTELLEKRFQPIEDHIKFGKKLIMLVVGIASFTATVLAILQAVK